MSQPVRESHWLTVTYATIYIVFYESRLLSADKIREKFHPYAEQEDTMPDARALISSDQETDLIRGLHLFSSHIFDWHSLGLIFGWLLEEMVIGNYTIHQVIIVMKQIIQDTSTGGFIFSEKVTLDFNRDSIKLTDLIESYQAIQDGLSIESMDAFQERVLEWLNCYGTL